MGPTPSGLRYPRHPEEVARRRGRSSSSAGGAEECRPDATRLQRRPRDRQSHLHPSGHQRNLPAPARTELNLTERLFASRTRRQAALLPPSLLHRPGARHQRPGRPRRPRSATSATSSSATRSTPATGMSTRASPRRRSPTASFSRCATCRPAPGCGGPSSCCTMAAATARPPSPRLPVLIQALRDHGYTSFPSPR